MKPEFYKISEEQAITLSNSGFWKDMSHEDIAHFQLFVDRLCMPFDIFQESVEKTLGRGVWTHEFAYIQNLRDEILGKKPKPSMEEILNLIPEEKRIVIEIPSQT